MGDKLPFPQLVIAINRLHRFSKTLDTSMMFTFLMGHGRVPLESSSPYRGASAQSPSPSFALEAVLEVTGAPNAREVR